MVPRGVSRPGAVLQPGFIQCNKMLFLSPWDLPVQCWFWQLFVLQKMLWCLEEAIRVCKLCVGFWADLRSPASCPCICPSPHPFLKGSKNQACYHQMFSSLQFPITLIGLSCSFRFSIRPYGKTWTNPGQSNTIWCPFQAGKARKVSLMLSHAERDW